ncbi:hypothetical protein [Nonomuraea jiangxiensis]|uniref:Uncharacterized protein n=1 Tax=Nonomuraea jiangxiensis TaxID=633440 RepID=A0A1G8VZY2_9ACTN|nr:hypothetical protein [Nonomuraea jiangxiensis]SDJ71681.1 hypothetical protein SAMN05421869_1128 [Nonomuraea jiangxiensis]
MDSLKAMWATVPPATPDDLAGARQRLLDGMRARPGAGTARRRVVTVPRLVVAAGVVAAVSVASAVITPGTPAYAVGENPDGTITVTVNELRDPEGLEADLEAAGIKADVTYLAPNTRCEGPRFASVDGKYDGPPFDTPEEMRRAHEGWRSAKATRPISVRTIGIHPEHIQPNETLVLEFRENQNSDVPWTLGAFLARAGAPVQPCTPVASAG